MKKQVIKSLINIGSYNHILNNIIELSKLKNSSYVCVANVHMTIEGVLSESFQEVVNNADITTPDGMPLAKAIKFIYSIAQDRVAGMDLMPDLIKKCAEDNMSIYLYGSTDKVLEKITAKATQEFPTLKIESYSPPFRVLSNEEESEIVNQINKFNPDFVFVALGCPKQEKWMAEHKDKVNSCMIGLGGAFEVYADVKNRAPKWMQDNSLEWLYRLIQDPKRLWKRYFVTNSLFVLLFIKQYILSRFKSDS